SLHAIATRGGALSPGCCELRQRGGSAARRKNPCKQSAPKKKDPRQRSDFCEPCEGNAQGKKREPALLLLWRKHTSGRRSVVFSEALPKSLQDRWDGWEAQFSRFPSHVRGCVYGSRG